MKGTTGNLFVQLVVILVGVGALYKALRPHAKFYFGPSRARATPGTPQIPSWVGRLAFLTMASCAFYVAAEDFLLKGEVSLLRLNIVLLFVCVFWLLYGLAALYIVVMPAALHPNEPPLPTMRRRLFHRFPTLAVALVITVFSLWGLIHIVFSRL